MQVPAVQRLMLTAAVRYDHYSDVGGTTNPKLGLIWDVVDGLRIRSTYSTSFRAPSLYDTSQAGFAVDGFFLPDSESPTGQSLALFLSGSSQPNLKPETAHNVTVGGTATPSWFPGFTASASYFNVNYTNQIAYPDTAVRNLFDPTAPDTQPFLIRNPSAAIVQPLLDSPQFFNLTPGPVSASDVQLLIDDRATNLAKTKVSGIDFSFGYAIGEFGFSALGTWMLNYDTSATSNPPVDHVGTAFFPPRLKTRIGATWTRNGLSAGGYWNFNPSYKDARYDDRPISENNTFDANVEYAFSDSDSDVLSGVSITLIANNIFDAKPPTIESPTPITFPTYDPANASLIGRFLSLAISKRW
jgi:iron complex outermembrane receptor protein